MAKNSFVDPPVGSLKETIRTKLYEHKKIPVPDESTFYRGSGFASVCPREEVLAAIHKITREDSFDANSLVTFALGTGIHVALQEVVLPAVGVLLGEWACLDCGKHVGGGLPFDMEKMVARPSECESCKGSTFRYVEQYFKDDMYNITGHPDGFVQIPGREGVGLFEAKSISPKGAWEVKKVPKFEHMIQAQIYMWFTGLQWACVFYWDKGVYGVDAFIEHFIERDEDTIEAVQLALLSIKTGIKTGELPDRICASPAAPRALTCPLAKYCFPPEENK